MRVVIIHEEDEFVADPICHSGAMIITALVEPAGNRTWACTVARYYSTTRPLVLGMMMLLHIHIYMEKRVQMNP